MYPVLGNDCLHFVSSYFLHVGVATYIANRAADETGIYQNPTNRGKEKRDTSSVFQVLSHIM